MNLAGMGTIKPWTSFSRIGEYGRYRRIMKKIYGSPVPQRRRQLPCNQHGELLSTMNTMTNTLTAALAGIASISLLVGGIGIMNMMLVSVKERTSEIGLRKGLGRTGKDQLQFLMESCSFSDRRISGGRRRYPVGNRSVLLKIGFHVSFGAVALGVCFYTLVGILFGWAPARNASLLNPIDALRSSVIPKQRMSLRCRSKESCYKTALCDTIPMRWKIMFHILIVEDDKI
jgi:hypothetical protein